MKSIPTIKESRHLHDSRLTVVLHEVDPSKYDNSSVAFNYGLAQSPFGEFFIVSCPYGILGVDFTDGRSEEVINTFRKRMGCNWFLRDDTMANLLSHKVMEQEEPFDLHICVYGTPFQIAVWSAVMDIPFGETVTYAELAERVGRPKAVRAVASAVASNRISYAIPCHRVVRSDGSVGEYRWGGAKRKAKMIAWEKSRVEKGNSAVSR